MATIGSSNFTVMRYVEESDADNPGYNAGDNLREIPMTGESFQFSSQFIESNNINSSRQVLDQIQTGYEVNGGLQIEFAPKVYDEFIQAALWADWQGTAKNTDYTVTIGAVSAGVHGGTITDDATGDTMDTGLVAGQWFYLRTKSGTPVADANVGIYKAKTVVGSVITIDESTPITTAEANKTCNICASMIRAPKNGEAAYMKRHKFFFERQHSDITPAQFFSYGGNLVNTFSIDGSSAALLTGSFDFIGEDAAIYNSAANNADTNPNGNGAGSLADLNGDSKLAALAFNGFNAVSHIKGIYLDGTNVNKSAGGDIYIQSLNFSINNALRGAQAMGYMGNVSVQAGKLGVTGNISSYFANDSMYRRFLNGDEFELAYVVEDENNDAYVFTFPRVVISTSSMNAGGNDQDLIENMEWRALYDSTYETSIQIDRLYSSYS